MQFTFLLSSHRLPRHLPSATQISEFFTPFSSCAEDNGAGGVGVGVRAIQLHFRRVKSLLNSNQSMTDFRSLIGFLPYVESACEYVPEQKFLIHLHKIALQDKIR